jgi:3-hydroxybutyryl-CoA dehydrogenase
MMSTDSAVVGERASVGVVGSGTMGVGIATVMARAGHETTVCEVNPQRLSAGLSALHAFLEKSEQLGKMTKEESQQAVARVRGTTRISDLSNCTVVVEAIFEDVVLKAGLFTELDDVCAPEALFHTNTSTLSVTEIAAGSRYPERVVGTHYCNPAPLMKLVEIARARQTADWAYDATRSFVVELGKTPVVTRDTPGFIVNRFLIPFENDCIRLLAAGYATAETIDLAITKGLGYPMGPFRLLDVVGLDVHRAVSVSLYDRMRERRFAPPPLVDEMIAAGHLGRKTGRGFYEYETPGLFGT